MAPIFSEFGSHIISPRFPRGTFEAADLLGALAASLREQLESCTRLRNGNESRSGQLHLRRAARLNSEGNAGELRGVGGAIQLTACRVSSEPSAALRGRQTILRSALHRANCYSLPPLSPDETAATGGRSTTAQILLQRPLPRNDVAERSE
jgi:hypothetical protein